MSNIIQLHRPAPRVSYYHYSRPDSQGSLLCETKNFPSQFNMDTHSHALAYSDRMAGWNRGRFDKACEIAGGDQSWAITLPRLTDRTLKRFAKIALGLNSTPDHVRVVYHFNIATGYSCPTVEAIWKHNGEGV